MSELVAQAPAVAGDNNVKQKVEVWFRNWRRLSRDNKSLLDTHCSPPWWRRSSW